MDSFREFAYPGIPNQTGVESSHGWLRYAINDRIMQFIKFKQFGINHLRSYLPFRPKEDCSLVGHSTADGFCDHSFTPG